MIRQIAVLVFVLAMSSPAFAQQDPPGAKDHPMVSRFPGYVISNYDQQDFGAYEFEMPDGIYKKVEGKYWQFDYELIEGRRKGGPVEISRNYLKIFTDRGGAKVIDDVDSGGGKMVARLPMGGTNIWLECNVSNGGENYTLTIVEEARLEQKVEFTALELANTLNEKGAVALHGILFDTGKATIKPESAAALAPVVDLLKTDVALKLEIQGHTDNVGAAAANLKLSQDRAAAVKTYLVQQGIVAARLTTAGFGDTKPVADNKTEGGRGQNRRVELVKK